MPAKGHFVLHSRVLPPVTAGRYEFVSRVTGLPFTTREERTHVTVSSPRYTMPPDQILSSFPPANGEGAFGDRLPQVVLKRRTLPWERNPAGGVAVSTTPWLALVVVAEGEAELSTTAAVADCVTKGVTLPDPDDRDVDQSVYLSLTASAVRKIFPTKDDLSLLVHVREVDVSDTELANGDDDGWLAVVLANRLPVMDTATGTPVRYLACLVNLEGQLDALPEPSAPVNFFAYAAVEDWRVLAEQTVDPDQLVMGTGTGVAHVSLDAAPDGARRVAGPAATGLGPATRGGLGAALDGAAAQRAVPKASEWASVTAAVAAAAADPDAQRLVRDVMGRGWRSPIGAFSIDPVLRFPVLAHWSFTTTEGATFETLMQGLDVGLLGTLEGERVNPPADPQAPAPPEAPPRPAQSEVLETGHIHLGHRTRRGDRAAAWYRGPLVPHPTKRDQPVNGRLPVAHAADQLRRVVPDGGEDLGYAAAFEIGRLLALSQLSVVSALLRFRGEQFGRERVRQIVSDVVPLLTAEAAGDLSRFVSASLVAALAEDPGLAVGPHRPVVDPGRPVDAKADLDAVVATGLGLDLAVLRKTGDQVGVLAALAATPTPVAVPERGAPVDRELLAQSLDTTLLSAVEVALPAKVRTARETAESPARAPRAARRTARPQHDALDALLEGLERGDASHIDPDEP